MHYLILFILSPVLTQWITSPQLDCRRVHPSFCCTSRIRSVCPVECAAIQCGPEYYQRLFSTDLSGGSNARDSSTNRRVEGGPVEEERETAVVDVTPFSADGTTPFSVVTRQSFPTLIPFEPNIDEIPSQEKNTWDTTPLPKPAPIIKKSRTPDPRIIRPPDGSLVLISDYEEESVDVGMTPLVSNTGTVTVPSTFIENQQFTGSLSSRSISHENFIKEKQTFGGFNANGAVDGIAGRKKDIANGISSLIQQFKLTPSATKDSSGLQSGSATVGRSQQAFLPTRPAPPFPSAVATAGAWQMTPAPVQLSTPVPCGIAPNFTPCVSSETASLKLLSCCRQKNLPPGCQSLCRYDITQAEVRSAMDRGQCGLLHVAPFLECAAQGKDNSQCCSARGVPQKSGPQCLQFCHPNMGLTALGLQHIVCGNAIGDMLYCHHSGLRP